MADKESRAPGSAGSIPSAGGIRFEVVKRALKSLTRRERAVIELRYGLKGKGPWTYEEIGRAWKVSWAKVRMLENLALKKLWDACRCDEARTLASLTAIELARTLESSDLASRLRGVERRKVGTEIARLSDRDRYILGLAGYYGYSTRDIAFRLCRDPRDLEGDFNRIFKRLRGEEGAGP